MDQPLKPNACGCGTDNECPEHRWANALHDDQGWDDAPGHPGISVSDDLLDL